jgi:hypothetical protein
MQRRALVIASTIRLRDCACSGQPVWASDPEPTMKQIHEAAATGHLDKAQQMITEVLGTNRYPQVGPSFSSARKRS